MDNAESLFVSGASFRGVSTCVRRLKLMSDAANDISAVVRSQYEEFSELSEVEFDGRYKVESDECFSISDYVDADGTFASFQEIINGNCSDVLKNTDSLSECRALLFRAPQLPNLVLIQRFTNSYLAKRDRWFGFGCSDCDRTCAALSGNLTPVISFMDEDRHSSEHLCKDRPEAGIGSLFSSHRSFHLQDTKFRHQQHCVHVFTQCIRLACLSVFCILR
jgi:hypothetical protein